jgi:hypothetical protein
MLLAEEYAPDLTGLKDRFVQTPLGLLLQGEGSAAIDRLGLDAEGRVRAMSNPESALQTGMDFMGGGLLGMTKSVGTVDDFLNLASKGKRRITKTSSQELKDLRSGKSDIAELQLNPDDPNDLTKIMKLEDEGYTLKESWNYLPPEAGDYMIAFKNKNAMKKYQKATEQHNPYAYGKLYGYSDADIASFYRDMNRGSEAFYRDKNLWNK